MAKAIAVVLAIVAVTGCMRGLSTTSASNVDVLFADWNKPDSPGCGVGVSQNGTVVFERGYGLASLEFGVPITSETVFNAASISKQFTAMSIVLLAEQGKLSLDDEVWKYVPGWAGRQHRVTIRQLLAHTAGLRDAFLLIELASPRLDGANVNDQLMDLLAHQRGLNFDPGTEFRYNNGGYNLLGSIVKRVSGQSLRDFAGQNIFKPLGMTHTLFHDDWTHIVPNLASGYHRDDRGGLHLARSPGESPGVVGNAGLVTTVRDLLRWEQNFADVRIGDRTLVAEMQTAVTLTGGETSPYGLGLEVGEDHGLKTVGHGGGDRGIATYVIRYPEPNLAIAVLCNVDNVGAAAGALARQVASLFLPELRKTTSAPVANPPRATLSAADLQSKIGLYRDPSSENYARLFVRDEKLWVSPGAGANTTGEAFELAPVDANHFVLNIPGSTIAVEFIPASAGHPQQSRVTGVGPKPEVSELVAEDFKPSPAELDAFKGEYYSRDLETPYTLVVRDGTLMLQIPGRSTIDLHPVTRDRFSGELVGMVVFSRDARHVVTGFTVNATDVHGLAFERLK